MKSKQREKFQYNPAKEIIASAIRVYRRRINPGDTLLWSLRPHDVAEGEVMDHLEHHKRDEE